MLRLTKTTDYGVVLLTQIAKDWPIPTHNARDLAEQTGIPLPMVSKILKQLTREGLLASHRGVKGGYALTRPPEALTLAEIVTALEGPIGLTECSVPHEPGSCQVERNCSVRSNMNRLSRILLGMLDQVTLREMTRPHWTWGQENGIDKRNGGGDRSGKGNGIGETDVERGAAMNAAK